MAQCAPVASAPFFQPWLRKPFTCCHFSTLITSNYTRNIFPESSQNNYSYKILFPVLQKTKSGKSRKNPTKADLTIASISRIALSNIQVFTRALFHHYCLRLSLINRKSIMEHKMSTSKGQKLAVTALINLSFIFLVSKL